MCEIGEAPAARCRQNRRHCNPPPRCNVPCCNWVGSRYAPCRWGLLRHQLSLREFCSLDNEPVSADLFPAPSPALSEAAYLTFQLRWQTVELSLRQVGSSTAAARVFVGKLLPFSRSRDQTAECLGQCGRIIRRHQ